MLSFVILVSIVQMGLSQYPNYCLWNIVNKDGTGGTTSYTSGMSMNNDITNSEI